MAINDRFWRLVVIFWSASAVALILSLATAPLLRQAVSDQSIRSAVVAPAAAEFSSARVASVQPTAAARLVKEVTKNHRHVRYIHRSSSISAEATLPKTQPMTSTKATIVTLPKASIVVADGQPIKPPTEGTSPAVVEPAPSASLIESAGKQVSDGVASAQKWLVDETGINVHGLVNIGTNYNFNQPATGNNTYRVFDYFGASSFEPNQAELYLNRSVPNQLGFVVDLNFWNTAEVMHGLTSYYGDQPGSHNPTGWMDPTQVYLTYTIPVGKGINLSAGRQVSLIGFEYIPSWNNINFNQSIDLLYSLGEPFTVTGVRATYPFTDHFSATFGVNNGWDTIATTNLFQTLEGQVSLMPNDSLTWNLQGMYGPSTGTQSGSKRALANTTVAWKTPFKPLQLGFEYLFADQSPPVIFSPLTESPAYTNPLLFPGAQPIQHSVWWSGIGLWAAYNPTDDLQLATRGEWFSDTSGARSGIAQNLGEVTETISYSFPFLSNLTARLEYRHDISSAHPFPNSGPFVTFVCPAGRCISTAHTYSGQDTLESALILKF
jgi:Putative beta-barrel porin-2, OmpL-like. bbp2